MTSYWQRAADIRIAPHAEIPLKLISVVIIGRNEAGNIKACLESISQNEYPIDSYEIIFIDDHSEDDTLTVVHDMDISNLKIFALSDVGSISGKKAALQYAISQSNGELIACTDADCTVTPQWLKVVNQSLRLTSQSMITQLIGYEDHETILSRFQSLDLMATMAFNLYGINQKIFYSANGANMAFRKSAYQKGDFSSELASGDDVFLINAMASRDVHSVRFIKSKLSIVTTRPERTFRELKHQRKRWATKSKAYPSGGLFRIQAYILMFHLYIVTNLIIGFYYWPIMIFTGLFALFLKGIVDYFLLNEVSQYYNQPKALKWYVLSFLLFFPYILLMAFYALFGKGIYWKGRELE